MTNSGAQKKCFFVSPIGAEGSEERRNSDRLIKWVIEPVCLPLNIRTERADHIATPGRITNQVAQSLLTADLVIADLSGLNPNVMYELGVRHGLRLPVVQVALENTKLPFDVLDIRTVFYTLDLDHVDRAKEALRKTVVEAMEGKGQPYVGLGDSLDTPPTGGPLNDRHTELLSAILDRSEDILRTLQLSRDESKGYAVELYQAVKGVEDAKTAEFGVQLISQLIAQGIQNPKGMREFGKVIKTWQPKGSGGNQQTDSDADPDAAPET